MRILSVVGARPNFMKLAPLLEEFKGVPELRHFLVHAGQHYDESLSANFFQNLNLPNPDASLDVGSGSHAWQTAEIMKRLEPVVVDFRPDLVIVVGDVNSTLAAALTAAKLQIRVAHVEAGLRSFDWTMPEEINRKLTDALADFLFVSEESAVRNLRNEGVSPDRIFFVGNVMIDTLLRFRSLAAQSQILQELSLQSPDGSLRRYVVVTLHRPSNVDDEPVLRNILEALVTLSKDVPVVFPVHPRTQERMKTAGLWDRLQAPAKKAADSELLAIDPLSYLDFLRLMDRASLMLTDSGGIQEETTVLGVPCLTLRANTERPSTIEFGTNRLVASNTEAIVSEAKRALSDQPVKKCAPPLWDGNAASRIVQILVSSLAKHNGGDAGGIVGKK